MRVRQEAIFEGHADIVRNLVYSPDGKLLVSSSRDGSVRVWDIGERQQRHAMSGFGSLEDLPVFPAPTSDVSWSPDGARLAVAGPQGGVHLCDATGKPTATIEPKAKRTRKVLFSPDGQHVLGSFNNGSIFVWTPEGDEIAHLSTDKHDVTDFMVSFDGAWIAAGDSAGYLTVWEAKSWQTLARVHATPEWRAKAANREDCRVSDIQFVAEGSRLVLRATYGSYGGHSGHRGGAWDIVSTNPGTGYDMCSLSWVQSLPDRNQAPHMVASRDGQQLLVVAGWGEDSLALYDPYTLSQTAVLSNANKSGASVLLLQFSPDGQYVAGAIHGGRVLIWYTLLPYSASDLAAHTELWETAELGVDCAGQDDMGEPPVFTCTALAWSPDGRHLATAGIDPIDRKPYRAYIRNERYTIKLWATDYSAY